MFDRHRWSEKLGDLEALFSDTPDLKKEIQILSTDRTGWNRGGAKAVVFPKDEHQLQRLILFAREHRISLLPSGGRTGYAGGAVASPDEIVVSLSKMNRLITINSHLPSITVEAGMITEKLQQHASEVGYDYPVRFASTGTSTIGGNIATNAGGSHVIRYGTTSDWVLGLRVVTGKGEILNFSGEMKKNNSGYDLKKLFCGSEGTLGFITQATMRLTYPHKHTLLILGSCRSYSDLLNLLSWIYKEPVTLHAFEYFDDESLECVCRHLSLNKPFSNKSPLYCLIEIDANNNTQAEDDFLSNIINEDYLLDAIVSTSSEMYKTFWSYREGISESLSMNYRVHKNDISIPAYHLIKFIDHVKEMLSSESIATNSGIKIEVQPLFFGHIGDGNIHLNFISSNAIDTEEYHKLFESIDHKVYQLINELGGSISAEHGIGLLKKRFLTYTRSQTEIEIMRNIKKIFDPDGILSVGRIFDL